MQKQKKKKKTKIRGEKERERERERENSICFSMTTAIETRDARVLLQVT